MPRRTSGNGNHKYIFSNMYSLKTIETIKTIHFSAIMHLNLIILSLIIIIMVTVRISWIALPVVTTLGSYDVGSKLEQKHELVDVGIGKLYIQ